MTLLAAVLLAACLYQTRAAYLAFRACGLRSLLTELLTWAGAAAFIAATALNWW